MDASFTEENYLKTIFHLAADGNQPVNTNRIAAVLKTKAASVTDMIKKLSAKNLIYYTRYQGVSLTEDGKAIALKIIRKHRLWEFFLVDKLAFGWDEVHELAEQLEHIQSPELINRLDQFLGRPTHDPHGDPIPDENGTIKLCETRCANTLMVGESGTVSGVKDHSKQFLQYLEKIKLVIGEKIKVDEVLIYDGTLIISTENNLKMQISKEAAQNLLITI